MKIVSVNEKHSIKGEIALLTQPSVTAAMFDKLRAPWRASPLVRSIPIKLEGPLFIMRISKVTPEIAQTIQKLLDDAEQAVRRDEDAARQKAELEKTEERKRIEAAAEALGVPIQ